VKTAHYDCDRQNGHQPRSEVSQKCASFAEYQKVQDVIILVPALAVAFAASCVWLGVRIFNRRERWVKWTAVGLGVLLAYPLSFGPACWMTSHTGTGTRLIPTIYRPLIRMFGEPDSRQPMSPIGQILMSYSQLCAAKDSLLVLYRYFRRLEMVRQN
jgi:hypothetical protein